MVDTSVGCSHSGLSAFTIIGYSFFLLFEASTLMYKCFREAILNRCPTGISVIGFPQQGHCFDGRVPESIFLNPLSPILEQQSRAALVSVSFRLTQFLLLILEHLVKLNAVSWKQNLTLWCVYTSKSFASHFVVSIPFHTSLCSKR